MKKLVYIFCLSTIQVFAQTTTDSVATPVGDFVLVTEEEFEETTGYFDETSTTSDGGTSELIELSSGARYAAPLAVVSNFNVQMLPNPSQGIVELKIDGVVGTIELVVTDVLGQTVYSTSLSVDGQRIAYLPAQLWANGTYFVSVHASDQTHVERLVVR